VMTPDSGTPQIDDFDVMLRYAQGACTDAERIRVATMVAEHPAHARMVAVMQESRWDVEAQLDRALSIVDGTASARSVGWSAFARSWKETRREISVFMPLGGRWIGITMVLGMAIAAIGVWRAMPHAPTMVTSSSRVYTTTNAQHANITLPDGSRVLLGDASRLTVSGDFGRADRRVVLVGEGYFTVRDRHAVPFIVTTGNTTTRVLGTAFSVRKYRDDAATVIAVASGRVVARRDHLGNVAEAVLVEGNVARISDSTAVPLRVTPAGALETSLDWTTKRLVFADVPITTALPRIARRYDIDIRLADARIGDGHLSAIFGAEPVERVLDDLALALESTYTRSGPNGRVVTFTPGRRAIKRVPPAHPHTLTLQESSHGR
jgi:ferric-dicitrate binding protein FerR (iron transport regulator)